MPCKSHLSTKLCDLLLLKEEWDALTAKCPESPIFLNWEWVNLWMLCFDGQPWILTVRSNEGDLLGIAPLMMEKYQAVRVLRFISAGMVEPDHLNILCQESFERCVFESIASFLLDNANQWDLLDLESIAENAVFPDYFDALLGKGLRRKEKICPYIKLQGIESWDKFQKERLSSHMRSKGLRYLQNVLERENPGEVYYERIVGERFLEDALDNLIEQHRGRWAEKKIYTPFEDERFLDFHRRFAAIAMRCGWLGLYRLRISSETIATVYGFYYQGRFFDYQHALNSDWSKFSPGRQLISFIIKDCIRTGQSEYDFLCGTEQYKYSWTKAVRSDSHIIWSAGLNGRIVITGLRIKDWLKSKVLSYKSRLKARSI